MARLKTFIVWSLIFLPLVALGLPSEEPFVDVCGRSYVIKRALEREVQKYCEEITAEDLAHISTLAIVGQKDHPIAQLGAGDLSNLTGLVNLGVNSAGLKRITARDFDHLPELQSLELWNNQISEIDPRAFQSLTRLRDLNLENNNLSELRTDLIWPLRYLHGIKIGGNPFRRFPPGFFSKSTFLMELSAAQTALEKLESRMFENTQLKYANFSRSKISEIETGTFDKAGPQISLGWDLLALDGNPLVRIPPGTFRGITVIETLLLSDLPVTEMELGVFDGMNIRQVNLGSSIEKIPDDLFANVTIQLLNVSSNPLSRTKTSFLRNSKIETVNLPQDFAVEDAENDWQL